MIGRSIVLLALCLFLALAASASEIERRSVDSQSQAQTGEEKDRTALLQGQITVARKVSVAGRRPSHDAVEGTNKEEAESHACSDDFAGHAGCPDQGDGTNLLQSRVFVAHTPAHEDVGDMWLIRRLTHLSLRGCEQISGNLDALAVLKKLRDLDLALCGNVVGDIGVHQTCTQLVHLNQGVCEEVAGAIGILQACMKLVHPDLSKCMKVTGETGALQACTKLVHLNLADCVKARKLLQLGSHVDVPPIGVPTDDAGRLNLVQQEEMSSRESGNDTGLTDEVSDASELKTWGAEVTEPSNKSQSSDYSQEEREMREAYVVTEALSR